MVAGRPTTAAVVAAVVWACVALVPAPAFATPQACTPYTSSGNGAYSTCTITLDAGVTVAATTCSYMMAGASASGDTYLYLFFNGVQVAANDDASGSCTTSSYVTYTTAQAGTYTIREACYSTGSCSGTVMWDVIAQPCSMASSCTACQNNSSCGWCGSTDSSGSCMLRGSSYADGYRSPTCSYGSTWSTSGCTSPYSCSLLSGCTTCAQYSNCAYCAYNSNCYPTSTINSYCSASYQRTSPASCASSCASATSCSSCTTYGSGCSWCYATGTCMSSTAYSSCAYGLRSYCSSGSCYSATTCATCASLVQCGWCNSTKQCVDGTAAGPTYYTCANAANGRPQWQVYNNNTCPADPYTGSGGSSSSGTKLSGGAVAGIVIGGIVFSIAVCSIACVACCRANNARQLAAVQASKAQTNVMFAVRPASPLAPQPNHGGGLAPAPAAAANGFAVGAGAGVAANGAAGHIVCQYCRWSNPPHYAFCGSCGRNIHVGANFGAQPPMALAQPAMAQPAMAPPLAVPYGMNAAAVYAHPQYTNTGYNQYSAQAQVQYAVPGQPYVLAAAPMPMPVAAAAPVVVEGGPPGAPGGVPAEGPAPVPAAAAAAQPQLPPPQFDASRVAAPSVVAPPPAFNPNAAPAAAAAAEASTDGRVCPACHLVNEPGFTFCSRCAATLPTPAGDAPRYEA